MENRVYTKAEIFKAAHLRARKNNTMNYKSAFGVALKSIYWMIKNESQIQSNAWVA